MPPHYTIDGVPVTYDEMRVRMKREELRHELMESYAKIDLSKVTYLGVPVVELTKEELMGYIFAVWKNRSAV